jgi:hypothetical protein
MSAVLSPCKTFRYRLERDLGQKGPTVALYGVNPSTADAVVNDQTIRKDIGFGVRLGWGRIIKANKFAFRATDIRGLRSAADPVGPMADNYLVNIMIEADLHVACWGPLAKLPPTLRNRWREVVDLADFVGIDFACFGTARDGQPLHTLMLAYDTPLVRWTPPA